MFQVILVKTCLASAKDEIIIQFNLNYSLLLSVYAFQAISAFFCESGWVSLGPVSEVVI